MGQYYKFMNLDKKQRCDRNQYMLKLLEHSYLENEHCMDILSLLSNKWKGDRVLHVGDYANGSDGTTTCEVIGKIEKDYQLNQTVYDWQDEFEDVKPEKKKNRIRYVYNLDKKEYIDLLKQPIQWFWLEKNGIHFSKLNSFALLVGCGNEQGGGDYRLVNHLQVGSWAGDHFVSSDSMLKDFEDFKENNYIFNEELGISKNRKKYDKRNEQVILFYEEKAFLEFLNRFNDYKEYDINKFKLQTYFLTDNEKERLEDFFERYKIFINNREERLEDEEEILQFDEKRLKEVEQFI